MKSLLNIKNDSEFLEIIRDVIEMLSNQFGYNNMIYIKDLNNKYIYATDSYTTNILGIKDTKSIIGKTDKDLNIFPGTDFVEVGTVEDEKVLLENHMISYLKIYPFVNGVKPLIFNKAALFNKFNNRKVGIAVRIFEISIKSLISKILEIHSIKLGLSFYKNQIKNYKLTNREEQIIFLFLANFGSLDIAKIINQIEGKKITKSYVDKVFSQQLYAKFNVNDRKALFDKLNELGFSDYLPSHLLKFCSIEVSRYSPV